MAASRREKSRGSSGLGVLVFLLFSTLVEELEICGAAGGLGLRLRRGQEVVRARRRGGRRGRRHGIKRARQGGTRRERAQGIAYAKGCDTDMVRHDQKIRDILLSLYGLRFGRMRGFS